MSYDFYIGTEVDGQAVCLLDFNMTSNVAGMWNRAWRHANGLWVEPSPSPSETDVYFRHQAPKGASGGNMGELREKFYAMFVYMTNRQAELETLNPDNGWGDWEGARGVVLKLWDASIRWPSAHMEIHS